MADAALLGVTVAIGLGGGIAAGFLGVGGAILLIPLLIFVPPLLQVGRFEMDVIAGMTLVQVLTAGLAGLATHVRQGHVDRGLATAMGLTTFGAAILGGWGARYLPDRALEAVFAALAGMAALMMARPSTTTAPPTGTLPRYDHRLAAAIAAPVGVLAGLVGAGGAFLLMPVLLNVLRVPVRTAVGTSLAVVVAAAAGGLLAKGFHGAFPLAPTLALAAGAALGAWAGGKAGALVPARVTRRALTAAVVGIAILMVGRVLAG